MDQSQQNPDPAGTASAGSPEEQQSNQGTNASPVQAREHGGQEKKRKKEEKRKKEKDGHVTPAVVAPALIALVSGLVGGVITQGASFWVANRNAASSQQQSVEEYRRTNREKIYQDVLAQMTTLDTTTQSVAEEVEFRTEMERAIGNVGADGSLKGDPVSKILGEAQAKWHPVYDRFVSAVLNAELVSSSKVVEISKALQAAYFTEFIKATYGQMYPHGYPGMIPEPPPEVVPQYRDKSLKALRATFMEIAKADVATND